MASPSRPSRTDHPAPLRSRAVGAVITAATAATLTFAGCSATNPIATQNDYAPSDGVGAQLGDVSFGNLLVLTSAEGEPGTLLGSVTNRGRDDVKVTLGLSDGAAGPPIDVRAGDTVLLGPEKDVTLELDAVPAPPGAVVDLAVSSDAGGSSTVGVPVLDGTLPEYADLVPSSTS